jgi:hypothetical protein
MDAQRELNEAVSSSQEASAATSKALVDLLQKHKEELLYDGAFGLELFLGRCCVYGVHGAAAGVPRAF